MKKIVILVLICLVICVLPSVNLSAASSSYKTFEDLTVYGGKLISWWTEEEIASYQESVLPRKFFGWNIKYVYTNMKCTYTAETLYTFYNDGFTPIDYTYICKLSEKTKFDISVSGTLNIKQSTKGKINEKSFDNGLDAQIKVSVNYSHEYSISEDYSFKLQVDPQTKVVVYLYGEGRVFNGAAAKYFFFIRTHLGCFEIFMVTTQYHRVEKTKI